MLRVPATRGIPLASRHHPSARSTVARLRRRCVAQRHVPVHRLRGGEPGCRARRHQHEGRRLRRQPAGQSVDVGEARARPSARAPGSPSPRASPVGSGGPAVPARPSRARAGGGSARSTARASSRCTACATCTPHGSCSRPVPPPLVTKYAACSVRLRASASTDATREGIIDVNARVSIAATVSGGGWNTTCAGAAVSGSSWYRITAVDGTSVQTLYGVSAVYAASGLFKATVTTQDGPDADADRLDDADADTDADPDADAADALAGHDRGDRHQPLAGHDRLDQGRRRGQALRVHEGVRGHVVRRSDVRDEPRPGQRERPAGRCVPLLPAERHHRLSDGARPITSSTRPPPPPVTCCRSSISSAPADSARPS